MSCDLCAERQAKGRPDRDPRIHCRRCHATWTGVEAQHCVKCHHTFVGITAADEHRYRRLPGNLTEDRCIDPATADGWREKRPGVWTNAREWAGPT